MTFFGKVMPVDIVKLTVIALKQVKYAPSYWKLSQKTDATVLKDAWMQLGSSEQQRINNLVEKDIKPSLRDVIQMISECGEPDQVVGIEQEFGIEIVDQAVSRMIAQCQSKEQLTAVKEKIGADLTKQAWKLLTEGERNRITQMCKAPAPEPTQQPVATASSAQAASPAPIAPTQQPVEAALPVWSESANGNGSQPLQPESHPSEDSSDCEDSESYLEAPVEDGDKEDDEQPSQPALIPAVGPLQPKKRLFGLTGEVAALEDQIDLVEDEITPELQDAFAELLSQRDKSWEEWADKLDNCCALIKSRSSWAQTYANMAKHFQKLAEKEQRVADTVTQMIKDSLVAVNRQKVRTARFHPRICKNGGKAPVVHDDTPPEQLPERFTIKERNNSEIRAALEAGEKLSFAKLGERGTHLRI
jgi:hypothetical protein